QFIIQKSQLKRISIHAAVSSGKAYVTIGSGHAHHRVKKDTVFGRYGFFHFKIFIIYQYFLGRIIIYLQVTMIIYPTIDDLRLFVRPLSNTVQLLNTPPFPIENNNLLGLHLVKNHHVILHQQDLFHIAQHTPLNFLQGEYTDLSIKSAMSTSLSTFSA